MNKKLGQEPAFPITEEQMDRIEKYPHMSEMAGMSKRFYAACAAMQGILSNGNINPNGIMPIEVKVKLAYEYADELLKQENDE